MRTLVVFLFLVLLCGVTAKPMPHNEASLTGCTYEYKRELLRKHCGDFNRRRRRETSYQYGMNHFGTIHDRGGGIIEMRKRGKPRYCCGNKCDIIYSNTCI